MSVNGTITHLRAGDYVATVASVGASLVSLTYRGRHLVQPFGEDELSDGYQGCTLVPWPNRIVGGRYVVDGTVLEVPVNEPATGSALHGLGCFQHWVPSGLAIGRGTWSIDLPPVQGYPFDVVCHVDYVLDAQRGLSVTITGTNEGVVSAPFGASIHPYLSCDLRPVDECTLSLPALSYLCTDEALRPTGLVPVAGTAADFATPRLVSTTEVDNAYTDLPEGEWTVELNHPDGGGVRLISDARWVQLYTGDRLGRLGAAVEPMTCGPDAFNRDLPGVLLPPGRSRVLSLEILAVG